MNPNYVVSKFHSKITEKIVDCLIDNEVMKQKLSKTLVSMCVCVGVVLERTC